jgi:hypothetical protein
MDNFQDASLRHYEDAQILADQARFDNASHLIGIAAECALKARIELEGLNSDKVHLPAIVKSYRVTMKGRQRAALNEAADLLSGPESFATWDISDRYRATGYITEVMWEQRRRKTGVLFAALGMRKKA